MMKSPCLPCPSPIRRMGKLSLQKPVRPEQIPAVCFFAAMSVLLLAALMPHALAQTAFQDTGGVPELLQAREIYTSSTEAIKSEHAERTTHLDERYVATLQQLIQNLREDGDLQELIDIHDEIYRFRENPAKIVEDPLTIPASARNLREALIARRTIIAEQEKDLMRSLKQQYLNHLANIKSDLEREGRTGDVLSVETEILTTRQALAKITPEPEIVESRSMAPAATAQAPRTRVADRTPAVEPAGTSPAAVSMRVRRLSSTRDVDTRWQTRWGSYSRDLTSRIAVDITLFNMRSEPSDLTIEALFVARPRTGRGDRWIFDRNIEKVTLDQNFNTVIISKPLTASVSVYRLAGVRREDGGQIEGYIVRLLQDDNIVRVEASSNHLRQIGEDQTAIDDILRLAPNVRPSGNPARRSCN